MTYPHNPILPPDIFVHEGEAHVWEDGRLYIYGSFDIEGREGYCSDRYHVYSTDNPVGWVDHGVSFTIADISWIREGESVATLYAPACVEVWLDDAMHAALVADASDDFAPVCVTFPPVCGHRMLTLRFAVDFVSAALDALTFSQSAD